MNDFGIGLNQFFLIRFEYLDLLGQQKNVFDNEIFVQEESSFQIEPRIVHDLDVPGFSGHDQISRVGNPDLAKIANFGRRVFDLLETGSVEGVCLALLR